MPLAGEAAGVACLGEDLGQGAEFFEGAEGVGAFLREVRDSLEILSFDREEPIVDGSRIVVLARGRWRVRATGREVEARVANVFELREGRVARYRVFNDTAAFAAGMGLLRP